MTIRTHPEVTQTLPGRSRPYRLYTVDHCDFEDFEGKASTVTNGKWGVSYIHTYGEAGWELHVYDATRLSAEDYDTAKHAIYGTTYDTQEEANRAAWEAGALAFMVYSDRVEVE